MLSLVWKRPQDSYFRCMLFQSDSLRPWTKVALTSLAISDTAYSIALCLWQQQVMPQRAEVVTVVSGCVMVLGVLLKLKVVCIQKILMWTIPHRIMCSNAWLPAGGAVLRVVESAVEVLTAEECQWGRDLGRFQLGLLLLSLCFFFLLFPLGLFY